MQAVSVLTPALLPLAVKLIDKYIFDEDGRRSCVPKIIEVPAPPRFVCCCGRSTDEYNSETQTCSTCGSCGSTELPHYRPGRLNLPTKSTVRSSSTSGAFENEKTKSSNSSRLRAHSDSKMESLKNANSRYTREDTLAVLARNLKQEISSRNSEKQTSPYYYTKSSMTERSSSRMKINSASSSGCGSRKVCSKSISDSSQGSSRKHNYHSSEGCKMLKKY